MRICIILLMFLTAILSVFPLGVSACPSPEGESPSDFTLVISSKTTQIGEYAYAGRDDIKRVVFASPCAVREIGRNAFRECGSLEEIVIPEGVVKIGMNAFAYCGRLASVGIPSTVRNIESNAFSFCVSLKEIVMPASLTELESYAFSECVSLERAVLPPNKGLLGELIFSGCTALREIVEMSTTPPPFDCNSTLFDPPFSAESYNPYAHCILRVGKGRSEIYRKSYPWNLFTTIIEIP